MTILNTSSPVDKKQDKFKNKFTSLNTSSPVEETQDKFKDTLTRQV